MALPHMHNVGPVVISESNINAQQEINVVAGEVPTLVPSHRDQRDLVDTGAIPSAQPILEISADARRRLCRRTEVEASANRRTPAR